MNVIITKTILYYFCLLDAYQQDQHPDLQLIVYTFFKNKIKNG